MPRKKRQPDPPPPIDPAIEFYPLHPGTELKRRMDEHGLSVSDVHRLSSIPIMRLSELTRCARACSPETAIYLARFFDDTTPEYWLDKQRDFELALLEQLRFLVKLTVKPYRATE